MEGGGRVVRVHGPFVDDSEVESVANFLRQQGEPEYDDRVVEEVESWCRFDRYDQELPMAAAFMSKL